MKIEAIIKDLSFSVITPEEAIRRIKLLRSYSVEEIKKAGQIGELNSIDTNHLIKQLPEARRELSNGWTCRTCANKLKIPMDNDYCEELSAAEWFMGKNCKGKKYVKK